MASFKEIEAAELNRNLVKGNILLVDVRSDNEVANGIIQGARHIPLHLIPLNVEALDGDQPLVFYCHAGVRSAQAAAFLADKGRSNIYNLQGGVLAWGKAGFPFVPKTQEA